MADKENLPRVKISQMLVDEGEGLTRVLKRHHLSGIAISGTVGAGLFLTSGDILGLSGSLGSVIAYGCAGFLVMCVMFCLSELVSVRPSPGAFYEYPAIFVHPSLGFAASWAYWLAYACSGCTLTVEAAKLLQYWSDKLSGPVAILITLAPVILLNLFGPVIWYGRLEWAVKWTKILLILTITVLMIMIAAGVRGKGAVSIQPPSHQWDDAHLFSPGFCFYGARDGQCTPGLSIPGTLGTFLGIWNSISSAIFAFLGLEFVVIAAGEAKYPRHDLPSTVRWIYWFAIVVYVELMILGAINVPFDDPALRPFTYPTDFMSVPQETLDIFRFANNTRINTGDRSPFIIAVKRAGFTTTLPDVLNAALYLSALTAANTAFYVSSRTMYQLCIGGTVHPRIKKTLGSTTYYGLPLWAIFISICISLFSFLAAIQSNHNQIKSVVSRISVTCILCVYLSQCAAFIRYQHFYKMKFGSNRRYQNWPGHEQCYRSGLHQPAPAIIAIVFGSLLLLFNGWDTIFQAAQPGANASDLAAGLIKSYLGPTIFATLFFVHKYKHGRSMVTFREVRDTLDEIANVPEDQSNEPPRENVPWKRFLRAIM